jgi:hypothetical protein
MSVLFLLFSSPPLPFRLFYFCRSLSVFCFAVSNSRNRLYAVSLFMFLDHTHTHTQNTHTHTHTHGRIPLDEWSTHRRGHFYTQESNIHSQSGIRTREPSQRAGAILRLRPHSHRDSLSVADRRLSQCIVTCGVHAWHWGLYDVINHNQHRASNTVPVGYEVFIGHSGDRASWYILIVKANEMHYFSDLFDKVLYMFRTCPLSVIGSVSTLYTRNMYLSC